MQCPGEGVNMAGSAPFLQHSFWQWHRTGELLLDQGDQLVLVAGFQPMYPPQSPFTSSEVPERFFHFFSCVRLGTVQVSKTALLLASAIVSAG